MFVAGAVKRLFPVTVLGMDVGSGLEKCLQDPRISLEFPACVVKRGTSRPVPAIDISPLSDQFPHQARAIRISRLMERGIAVIISNLRIRSALQKNEGHFFLYLPRSVAGAMERGLPEFIGSVDVRPVLEQGF